MPQTNISRLLNNSLTKAYKTARQYSTNAHTNNMLIKTVLLLLTLVLQRLSAGDIACFSCTNATRLPECANTVLCQSGSACFSDYSTINGKRHYTLGCKSALLCPVIPTSGTGGASVVGRSTSGADTCSECCGTKHCNRQLCQTADPSCNDEYGYNCANIAAMFNICADSSNSKTYCRRFCGFCNTVDGHWSSWSVWSSCTVTCGNGTISRSRTCSNPAPENGGSDCIGDAKHQEICMKDVCPVHGGWSAWNEWGSCSSSCDIGLQRRDRSCSNPYPSNNGDHCYGDSRADRVCLPGACANGSWSSWGPWESCTQSCGGGVMIRNRDCNNPVPSVTGRYCDGTAVMADSCNTLPCYATGFSVHIPKESPTSNQLAFEKELMNKDKGFNLSTGVFTCRTTGHYYFAASLLKDYSFNGAAKCYIRKNDKNLVIAYSSPGEAPHPGNTAAVTHVYVHLITGDNVTLGDCSPVKSFYSPYSSFSGFLVTSGVV